VVIGFDYIGSYKSNYYTITTTAAPSFGPDQHHPYPQLKKDIYLETHVIKFMNTHFNLVFLLISSLPVYLYYIMCNNEGAAVVVMV
jgi:hypothetical protein